MLKKNFFLLKSFYKLSDADVALLKKFGMNGVKGFDGKTAGLNKRALRLFNPKDTSNLKSSLQAMVFEMADDGFDENETLNFFDKLIYAEVKTLYKQAVK